MKIDFSNVSKIFNKKYALKHFNLNVNNGEIFCLLGKNGSGKSTVINLISQILQPNDGEITIINNDKVLLPIEIKRLIGLQSQYHTLIEEINAKEFLKFIGLIYHVDKTNLEERINELIDYFFLINEDLTNPIKTYSSGMKKKVQLCAAFLHKPKIVLLDEPFSSLDIISCNKLCNFINKYINKDRIIFISSHNLYYVEEIATNIGVLNDKKLIFNGRFDKFIENKDKMNIEKTLLNYLSRNLTS